MRNIRPIWGQIIHTCKEIGEKEPIFTRVRCPFPICKRFAKDLCKGTCLTIFKKKYSEIFKIRNANEQTGNTLSDYLKWCNFLSEKRKKITEVQVQITIFGVSVYMWCFHWQHNAIISTREKFSSFKRDPVYNVGSSVQFSSFHLSLVLYTFFCTHASLCVIFTILVSFLRDKCTVCLKG